MRETERERERERERYRQTDRQTDRKTDRQTVRQTHRDKKMKAREIEIHKKRLRVGTENNAIHKNRLRKAETAREREKD